MKRLILAIMAVFMTASGVQAADMMKDSYQNISVQDARVLIESTSDLVIIDVSPYFDKGHIPGAVNYPVGSGALDKAIPSLDKSKTYLVYCHGDAPAIRGAEKLVAAGFKKVYRLEGNYGAWVAAGFPVEM